MTPIAEHVQRLVSMLDQEVKEAEERVRLAEAEYESAKEAHILVRRQRDGVQLTFEQIPGVKTESTETESTLRTPSLQLVPALASRRPSANQLAEMTSAEKLQHVLGDRTLTLDEIKAGLKAAKIAIPHISQVLSASKHNVLGADEQPMRDADTGKLIKENTFISTSRGSWRVALPEDAAESSVLTRTQAQAEMLMNRRTAIT